MSATHAQVWDAYQRVWGRIEGRGYRINYTGLGPYSGCVWWDTRLVQIRRTPTSGGESPDPADEETVRKELCVLCHELAHIEYKDDDEQGWLYYFGVLNQWGAESKEPPAENRARIILAEEERAEAAGRRILRRILPEPELLKLYDDRAEESLTEYRKKLGLAKGST